MGASMDLYEFIDDRTGDRYVVGRDESGTIVAATGPLYYDDVAQALTGDFDSDPEVTADIACETALNALDQLMVLAAKDDTWPAVMANRIFVGQILTRAQLVTSFLMAKQPQPTLVYKR